MNTKFTARQLLAAIQARRLVASSRSSALEAVMTLGLWVKVALTQLLLGDAAANSDSATLQSNKALSDSAVTPEQIALHITQTFADSAYAAEVFSTGGHSYSNLGSTSSSVDDETLAFIKAVMEAPSVADVFTIVVAFSRQFDDVALTPETLALAMARNQDDAATSADAFAYAQASNRADEATGLDAALFETHKTADDLALTPDAFAFDLQTDRADFAGLLDSALLVVDKVFADASAVADAMVMPVERVFADSALSTDDFDGLSSAEDDQTMQFTKVLPDLATAVENFLLALQAQRAFDDLAVALDGVGLALERTLNESAAATDAAAVALDRPLDDSALGSDAASLTFSPPYFELAAAAELYGQSTSKALAEQPRSVDAGSLFFLDYGSPDFFAEDFVGETRTF
jgi:hypothetical protein